MSEKYTDVTTPHGGMGEWGHVDPQEAIRLFRAYCEQQAETAAAMLADIEAGAVKVFHQQGPWAMSNRRQVWPIDGQGGGGSET